MRHKIEIEVVKLGMQTGSMLIGLLAHKNRLRDLKDLEVCTTGAILQL